MIKQRHKRIIILAAHAGQLMMKSGAEIYRVEDTITRICKACGAPYVEAFVTPTGIFLSMDDGHPTSDIFTYIKRVKGTGVDLNKISELNDFSREFADTDLSVENAWKRVKEIAAKKTYPFAIRLLGASIATASFCFLYNGGLNDVICAAVIGFLAYSLSTFLGNFGVHFFIKGFLCCFFSVVASALCTFMNLGSDADAIMIGTIMLFVPGVAITNAIRDLIAGDMISGSARMTEAILVALSLATGTGVGLRILLLLGGVAL